MFSTPQSKAFFSQEIVKGKLIAQQIQLVNQIHQKILQTKCTIQQVLKILLQASDQTPLIEQKLQFIKESIQYAYQIVLQSNQVFSFEVSLRSDIKHLEHSFFKYILRLYQEKIKQLKHGLLLLQHEVQQLQQQGLLPYVQSPEKNNIISVKYKNYHEYKQKIQVTQKILRLSKEKKLQELIITIVNQIVHQKKQKKQEETSLPQKNRVENKNFLVQKLNKSQEIYSPPSVPQSEAKNVKQPSKNVTNLTQSSKKQQNDPQLGVTDMVELLHHWLLITNGKIKNCNRMFKRRIQSLSVTNKAFKQGIRYFKQIMNFQQTQAMIRCGQFQLTRQQTIDFLRQMNQDLQSRFLRRNIYMIVSTDITKPLTKSCISFKTSFHETQQRQNHGCLKQVNSNLNKSFLQQCSYLISDRFLADEDQNQQMIV